MKKNYLLIMIVFTIITFLGGATMAKEVEIVDGKIYDDSATFYSEKRINTQPDIQFTQTRSNMSFTTDSKINSISGTVFGVVAYVCYGAIFIILAVKGVQFMSVAPEGKAEIKKQMIAIATGGFIVFAIRQILIIISKLNLFN